MEKRLNIAIYFIAAGIYRIVTGRNETRLLLRTSIGLAAAIVAIIAVALSAGRTAGASGLYPASQQKPGASNAVSTPTACAIEFSDVPVGSTFYPYIKCLACRGIVSGYADGTFRPGNRITRGQLSKLVSGAAGYSEPVTATTFEDVPPTSTFYNFVERLASRGIIGGYPCGSTGQPCVPPENRPYFRPATSASRGQLAKIVCQTSNCLTQPASDGLVINEVFVSQFVPNEYFELYNTSKQAIDLSAYVIFNRDGSTPLSRLDNLTIEPGQLRSINATLLHQTIIVGSGLASTDFLGLITTSPSDDVTDLVNWGNAPDVTDLVNWGNAPDVTWPNFTRFSAYFFASGTQPYLLVDAPSTIQRWPDGYDTQQGSDWKRVWRSPADFSCGDPYESDDAFGQAPFQSVGTIILHRICSANDHDFIAIELSPSYTYTLKAKAIGSRIDIKLELYDVNGNVVSEDDPPSSRDGIIVIHPTQVGVYRVEVSDHNNEGASGPDFLYDFGVTLQGVDEPRTFEDVSPDSAFYTEIKQLQELGALSGYPCGALPAGPCMPPGNRPYFLPGANVTRGQAAKIVSETFFPDCYLAIK